MVFFFVGILTEAFLWREPILWDVRVNVDHKFEDLLEDLLDEFSVLLYKTWLALNQGDDKLERLLPNASICEILGCDDWLQGLEHISEVGLEKEGFDLSQLVKLDKSVLEHYLVTAVEGINNDSGHCWDEFSEGLGVFAFSGAEQVGDGLEGSEFDVEALVEQGLSENSGEVCLELNQVVHDVSEQAVEDLEGGVDLGVDSSLDECVDEVN